MDSEPPVPPPSLFRETLGFLLVGMAWGLTTPFIRRAAINLSAHPSSSSNQSGQSWIQAKISKAIWTVLNLLRTPAYAIPLVINLTGSIWFFLLVGKAGKLLPDCSRVDCRTDLLGREGRRYG
ncbi:hypothetical protein MMC22_007657 [Lobaria immixta]|nr:hypothetical protein [Lobaria immixta]